jgi:hypothetical protein
MSTVVGVLEPYAISIKETARSESCCVAEVYNRLGRGEYLGLKDGRRTLVLWESVKARRAKLRPAHFKAPQPQPSRFHIRRKTAEARTP